MHCLSISRFEIFQLKNQNRSLGWRLDAAGVSGTCSGMFSILTILPCDWPVIFLIIHFKFSSSSALWNFSESSSSFFWAWKYFLIKDKWTIGKYTSEWKIDKIEHCAPTKLFGGLESILSTAAFHDHYEQHHQIWKSGSILYVDFTFNKSRRRRWRTMEVVGPGNEIWHLDMRKWVSLPKHPFCSNSPTLYHFSNLAPTLGNFFGCVFLGP